MTTHVFLLELMWALTAPSVGNPEAELEDMHMVMEEKRREVLTLVAS
jgi:hypothetical protein